jgi:hypothetical protein
MGAHSEDLSNIAELLQLSWKTPKRPRRAQPIFVVGAPRSGTTLMTALLTSLPGAMRMIPEVSPFVPILDAYRKCLAIDRRNDGAFFGGAGGVQRQFGECLESIITNIQAKNGGDFVTLKAPILSKYVLDLCALLPTAQVICMVRHPVAVLRSMRGWGRKAAAAGRDHVYASATNSELYALIKSYYSKPLSIRDRQTANRLLFVRYEDLVTKSPPVVKNILAMSGHPNAALDFGNPYRNSKIDFSAPDDSLADSVTELFGQAVDPRRAEQALTYPEEEVADANAACPGILPYFYHEWRGQSVQTSA